MSEEPDMKREPEDKVADDAPQGAERGLMTEAVEPYWFSTLLVDKPGHVAGAAVAFGMFWLILIPVFGQPILDTGGESFRSNEGDIAESQFMFKAGLRASVSTGTQVACVDTDFATISTVGVAGKAMLENFTNPSTNRTINVSTCPLLVSQLANYSISCDQQLAPYAAILRTQLGLTLPPTITELSSICSQSCSTDCGDGASHSAALEHVKQSQPTNLLQLTLEAWEEDGENVDDVLTVANMQRLCDVEAKLMALKDMGQFCFKPAGSPTCTPAFSLCGFMKASTSVTVSGISLSGISGNQMALRNAAISQLLDLSDLITMTEAQRHVAQMNFAKFLQYTPDVVLSQQQLAAIAITVPNAKIDNTTSTLSGSAPYGACTGFSTLTSSSTSLTMTGCAVPDGQGVMPSSPAGLKQIANNLKNSNDMASKNYLLTKDFLSGLSQKVSATKMRVYTGVPYDRPTWDQKLGLTEKSYAQCKILFESGSGPQQVGDPIQYENCEGVTTWLQNHAAPSFFKEPADPTYSEDPDKDKATEWWHILACGRVLLNYNAQCVENLNKAEQQALFTTWADDDLYPKLMEMMDGEGDFDFSGKDGELRIYFTEFSRLVQKYFDSVIGLDGLKALFAMVFSYLYIWFHTADFGIATVGMIHIMMSVPVSLSIYLGPFGFNRFNTLCPLGIFVILGIGADDIFIMVDCWKQSIRYFDPEDLHLRMAWTWKRASHAMLTTTLTTAAAFMANGMSPIPPIAVFGIFSALLVLVNYIFVITWFPAMIIMEEKGWFGYFIPAYCGCCGPCAGFSYLFWKRKKNSDTGELTEAEAKIKKALEEATTEEEELLAVMNKTELFFYHQYSNTIDKLKLPFIGGGIVITIVFLIFAVQLDPAEDAARFLPDDDPLQRCIDLAADPNMGVFVANEQQQFMNVYMGTESINRDDVNFLNANDYGVLTSVANFHARIADPAAHTAFIGLCNKLRDGAPRFIRATDNPSGEVYCVLEGFIDWLRLDRGMTYPDDLTTNCIPPCNRVELFAKLISDYANYLRLTGGMAKLGKTSYIVSFGNTPSDTLRFDIGSSIPCGDRSKGAANMARCRPLSMVQMYANVTFKFNSPGSEVDPAIDHWNAVIDAYNAVAPPGMQARQTAVRYVGVNTERVLLESAVWGTIFSLILAFLMILPATNNILVTGWSLLVITMVVNSVVGTMVMLGWTLGVLESICLTICVGLSVDYTIHLCHIFATSTQETRFGAGRDALASMGVSVMNAAATTLGSACVMMATYVLFFQRFGIFVFMNIFYSAVYAFVFLMAVLMQIGPIGDQGRVLHPHHIAKLTGRGAPQGDTAGADGAEAASDEQTTANPLKQAQAEELTDT